jgi:hypothetical protein
LPRAVGALLLSLNLCDWCFAAPMPLFSGFDQLQPRFGQWQREGGTLVGIATEPVGAEFHTETARSGILGTNFTYGARIGLVPREGVFPEAHLQFRIAVDSRYGVSLGVNGQGQDVVRLYKYVRGDRSKAAILNPPSGQPPCVAPSDCPSFVPLDARTLPSASHEHRVAVTAKGSTFRVEVDGPLLFEVSDPTPGPAVGRFGLYVVAPVRYAQGRFDELTAGADPADRANFALLYNTIGYELAGPKRALVRTLNDLPPELADLSASRFSVRRQDGSVALRGTLTPRPRTYGMQLWGAEFSTLGAGRYQLMVDVIGQGFEHSLVSEQFAVEERLFSSRILERITLRNAEARRASDEDFARNWRRVSGDWTVNLDGAFLATRADRGDGALLERLPAHLITGNLRYSGDVTIVSGCDAQLRFIAENGVRYAVTLQAGAAGACAVGTGPGAIRLHREAPDHQDLAATLFPAGAPFEVGVPYRVQIRQDGQTLHILCTSRDRRVELTHAIDETRFNRFALKVWGGDRPLRSRGSLRRFGCGTGQRRQPPMASLLAASRSSRLQQHHRGGDVPRSLSRRPHARLGDACAHDVASGQGAFAARDHRDGWVPREAPRHPEPLQPEQPRQPQEGVVRASRGGPRPPRGHEPQALDGCDRALRRDSLRGKRGAGGSVARP